MDPFHFVTIIHHRTLCSILYIPFLFSFNQACHYLTPPLATRHSSSHSSPSPHTHTHTHTEDPSSIFPPSRLIPLIDQHINFQEDHLKIDTIRKQDHTGLIGRKRFPPPPKAKSARGVCLLGTEIWTVSGISLWI